MRYEVATMQAAWKKMHPQGRVAFMQWMKTTAEINVNACLRALMAATGRQWVDVVSTARRINNELIQGKSVVH